MPKAVPSEVYQIAGDFAIDYDGTTYFPIKSKIEAELLRRYFQTGKPRDYAAWYKEMMHNAELEAERINTQNHT
jgi:hypothetical protein